MYRIGHMINNDVVIQKYGWGKCISSSIKQSKFNTDYNETKQQYADNLSYDDA